MEPKVDIILAGVGGMIQILVVDSMCGVGAAGAMTNKIFVGGLPPDIDEDEITASFRRFGPLVVDWPHKAESKSYFPPKGYAFLLFQVDKNVYFR